MNAGIKGLGVYIPQRKMTAAELAEKAGMPENIVIEKLGIKEKPLPGPDDHTCQMGIEAARDAINKTGVDPASIDMVIYIGEEYKEYPLWTAAIKLQEEIGAVNAFAFDMALRCGTTIMAVKMSKDMMIADPAIKTVLLAGGYRNVDFIDYENPRTRFMYNLGAGGAAMILERDTDQNIILGSHIITDGSFSEDVVVPVGGTKSPLNPEALEAGLYQLDVLDPEGMKARLEKKSMENFLKVIRIALEKSGCTQEDIDYVAILHMKRSAHHYVLNELGVSPDKSIYLEDYGHIGQMDQIISLQLAEERGMLKPGDIIVLVSAGVGYAWGANVIRWG
ncbi:3-oxoacyl-ACP synthase [Rossellomorea vietnamensis]|uniref:3-oxoacyl-ACP synthase n=1 Tax=Rossellomorea vietnamensis TaxID=218284 RepID=A0A5D4KEF9_9BACI|nr:3-oxoacyl-ACP synthase [Rossellomorea vietnamensis]TYR74603.1 3-oxoacyl-ACP synthase [Rossellomorea vietnamensis]